MFNFSLSSFSISLMTHFHIQLSLSIIDNERWNIKENVSNIDVPWIWRGKEREVILRWESIYAHTLAAFENCEDVWKWFHEKQFMRVHWMEWKKDDNRLHPRANSQMQKIHCGKSNRKRSRNNHSWDHWMQGRDFENFIFKAFNNFFSHSKWSKSFDTSHFYLSHPSTLPPLDIIIIFIKVLKLNWWVFFRMFF